MPCGPASWRSPSARSRPTSAASALPSTKPKARSLGWRADAAATARPLIAAHQLQAGERLRADFTRAHLMPRTTSNWSSPSPTAVAAPAAPPNSPRPWSRARQRVHQALDAVGPEFSGLLLDVCCFLKGLEDVERERAWPHRSAKIVLQLALDRLARHYGYAAEMRGPARAPVRTWLADDAAFKVDGS